VVRDWKRAGKLTQQLCQAQRRAIERAAMCVIIHVFVDVGSSGALPEVPKENRITMDGGTSALLSSERPFRWKHIRV